MTPWTPVAVVPLARRTPVTVVPPVAAPVAPPAAPKSPAASWRGLLDALAPLERVTIQENAAFLGYVDGRLALAVRTVLSESHVRKTLRNVEFYKYFDGFRALDVRIDADAGRTGGERRSAAEDQQRADANARASASPLLKRLVASFGARIETIVPIGAPMQDMTGAETESDDE